ncbi:hypothetical protein TRVL_08749 [Trypanosoma vivax]|nr:hypothetical protein TRVL_08749 [Trypanosoma vivax]
MPRGFGFGREPRSQWNVDGTSFRTENAHNETFQGAYKEILLGNVGRACAAFYCECEASEKQRRAAHKGAAIADGIREGTDSDVSVRPSEGSSGKSHKAGAANDAVGAELFLRHNNVRGCRVAMRLAWVTVCLWGEIALLLKESFIGRPSDRSSLVDWGATPKIFGADPRRAARCMAVARVVEKLLWP